MSNPQKKPTSSASDVAKYFIWKSKKEGKSLTNKKLQKLVYYAQAWHLALKGDPLFSDKIEAWIHGPAIASLYQEYKKFGYGDITVEVNAKEILNVRSKDVLDQVWDAYSQFDAEYLEFMTHNEDPWLKARENLNEDAISNNEISLEIMKEYYTRRLKEKSGNP